MDHLKKFGEDDIHIKYSSIDNSINILLYNDDDTFGDVEVEFFSKTFSTTGELDDCVLYETYPELAKSAVIYSFEIKDDSRGMGYGKKLLDLVINLIKEKYVDVQFIYLSVFLDNIPAIKLYERFGFKQFGETKELTSGDQYTDMILNIYEDATH